MKLILVDNNPEPTARPIYDAFCEGEGTSEFVHCPQPGIPVARNAGLQAALRAGADYIAILDDDEVAPPHWLRSLMLALEVSGADAVQGGVRQVPGSAIEDAASGAAPPSGKFVWGACESLATNNVLFKAWLVQPPLSLRFDETMLFTGGSDREFFMRAHKRGARLLRVRGVDVFEEVAEGRETLGYQALRSYTAGNNFVARLWKHERRPVAAARIVLRAVDSSMTGLLKLVASAGLLLALRPRPALTQWRKGCMRLSFAAGCITPVAGVRAYPYRNIQGA